jgi:hypothetical protein
LPEFYLLSPYFNVFPKYPNPVLIQNDSLGMDLAEKDTVFFQKDHINLYKNFSKALFDGTSSIWTDFAHC